VNIIIPPGFGLSPAGSFAFVQIQRKLLWRCGGWLDAAARSA
jgi:hypothetical protein